MNTFILVPRGASGGKGRFLKKLPLDPAKTFDMPLRDNTIGITLGLDTK